MYGMLFFLEKKCAFYNQSLLQNHLLMTFFEYQAHILPYPQTNMNS